MKKLKMETSRIEYKQKLTDDLEKEVVGFLNANGGDIYIGVNNKGVAVGVDKIDETQRKIKDRLVSNIRPSIMGLFDILTQEQDGKNIILVNLSSGTETPYYIKQKGRSEAGCFVRIGSSVQPMDEKMIDSLMARRHPVSLANMPSRHQDLTFNQLKLFYEGKGKILNNNFARSLDFITSDGKYNQLAFLFADENSFSIRVAKWWGTEKFDLRENEEYGYCSLIKAMQKVLDKFEIENITQARKVGIGARQEKRIVDNKSLREGIINAFAHNDYSTNGETPIFEIFSDRFEITTYGGLVEGLSKEDFFSGVSRLRNREIMRIFNDLEFVERLGSGMPYIVGKYGRKIFKFMSSVIRFAFPFDKGMDKEEGIKVKNTNKSVEKTTVKGVEKNNRKNVRKIEHKSVKNGEKSVEKTVAKGVEKTGVKIRKKIVEMIRKNSKITTKELAVFLGLGTTAIGNNLKKLKEQNIIRRIGSDKGGHWEVLK